MNHAHQRMPLLKVRPQQNGFTLIEVLIAVLVLAVGMVGLATLYLTSLASVHSGLLSSLASTIALDFEEQLWVKVGKDGDGTCPGPEDVAKWGSTANGSLSLPGLNVSATVQEPVLPGQRFREIPITITWTETRFGVQDDEEEFAYVARVYCTPSPGAQ